MDEVWGALGAVGTLASVVVAVIALVVAARAGSRASEATAQAVEAQRQAAEALRAQAATAARSLELQEQLAKPSPVRFRLVLGQHDGVLIQDGEAVARGLEIDVDNEDAIRVYVSTPLPMDVYQAGRVQFYYRRGGHPARSTLRLRWTNDDGSTGGQTIVV